MENPPALYKYMAFRPSEKQTPRLKQLFVENLVYFASPASFNDPFDCKVLVRYEGEREEHERLIEDSIIDYAPHLSELQRKAIVENAISYGAFTSPRHQEDFQAEIAKKVEALGIYSVSRTPTSILMWSHYSQNHTGLCLEFKPVGKPQIFVETECVHLWPVAYQETFPAVSETNSPTVHKLIETKAEQWKYEQEWRFIDYRGHGLRKFKSESLAGIIFGCRTDQENIERVKRWIRSGTTNPCLYKAEIAPYHYSLEIRPLQ